MSKERIFKKTERHGRTKVTTFLPQEHPVYQGVMEAKRMLGGEFPEHVGRLRILPDVKPGSKKDTVIGGQCLQTSTGGSVVRIYAGSIEEAVPSYLVQIRATNVTLHEFGHSSRSREMQEGAWIGVHLRESWEEVDAEDFVVKAHHDYQIRVSQGRPKMTMRQLLEQRKAQKDEK